MKKIIITAVILLSASASHAQNDSTFYKHEVKISYGIETFPRMIYSDNLLLGGFTVTYMYRVVKWFWVGANINWQFPSDIQYYIWREYYTDASFKDFETSKRNNFLAIAPELRFSYTNKKWATLYSALSVGYGIHIGLNKEKLYSNFLNDYWYWDVTFFGANFHIGEKQNFFVGGEFGLGFKGILSIHAGYRF